MKPKLTLKTNTMGILITIWSLWVPESGKSGRKTRRSRIFSYIPSLNKNRLVTINNRLEMVEWGLNWSLKPIPWVSWSQFEVYASVLVENQGVKWQGNRIFSDFSSLNIYKLTCNMDILIAIWDLWGLISGKMVKWS